MMSGRSGMRPRVLMGGLVGLIVLVGALLSALSSAPTREISLVVRNMAFYLEADPQSPNPTIDLKVGERVLIVVRNQDRGVTHDFAVPAFETASTAVKWSETTQLLLDAPAKPGSYSYVCRPHRLVMQGTIRVVP